MARASYFEEMCAAPDYLWDGFHSDPFSPVDPEPTIPLIRPINSPYSDQVIGWSYCSVSARLITDSLRSYPQPPDSLLYVTIGSRSYVCLLYTSHVPDRSHGHQGSHVGEEADGPEEIPALHLLV